MGTGKDGILDSNSGSLGSMLASPAAILRLPSCSSPSLPSDLLPQNGGSSLLSAPPPLSTL